ncbi:PEP-dependent dihydroxyacetone kinase, ADP-binding subunit DhaL [Candidatus Thermoflexus japonica]|uniref:PEP-dependent dihydroxyacetone kinase, ADP-binding subunit DhaL n=1 Tax=Candidatus Thermoflexus japonica TaxID=2035417 RepID=A0A2H5Y3Q9_9CHLR|nr:PEP-dependent dihydroxyacetone kinase, ADP-binding subunit DhaL [Candidatus Thermoflexus japonica]
MPVMRDDVVAWLERCAAVLEENRDYLTQLDAAIGDADHGANMDRGFKAFMAKLPSVADKDIGTILKTLGMTLVATVGGAGGPLYGTFFLQLGVKTANKLMLTPEDWAEALEAGINGVIARGQARPGDKTMVDALLPALEAFKEAIRNGDSFGKALQRMAEAAEQGMKATIPMVARKGRASYLGERSAGHQDPGATSSYLILKAAADTWANAT